MNKKQLIEAVATSGDGNGDPIRNYFREDGTFKDDFELHSVIKTRNLERSVCVSDAIPRDPLSYLMAHTIEEVWKEALHSSRLPDDTPADCDVPKLVEEYRFRMRYQLDQMKRYQNGVERALVAEEQAATADAADAKAHREEMAAIMGHSEADAEEILEQNRQSKLGPED